MKRFCAVDTSVNIRVNAGINSDDHSSIIFQLLLAKIPILGQARTTTVLHLSSRYVHAHEITHENQMKTSFCKINEDNISGTQAHHNGR